MKPTDPGFKQLLEAYRFPTAGYVKDGTTYYVPDCLRELRTGDMLWRNHLVMRCTDLHNESGPELILSVAQPTYVRYFSVESAVNVEAVMLVNGRAVELAGPHTTDPSYLNHDYAPSCMWHSCTAEVYQAIRLKYSTSHRPAYVRSTTNPHWHYCKLQAGKVVEAILRNGYMAAPADQVDYTDGVITVTPTEYQQAYASAARPRYLLSRNPAERPDTLVHLDQYGVVVEQLYGSYDASRQWQELKPAAYEALAQQTHYVRWRTSGLLSCYCAFQVQRGRAVKALSTNDTVEWFNQHHLAVNTNWLYIDDAEYAKLAAEYEDLNATIEYVKWSRTPTPQYVRFAKLRNGLPVETHGPDTQGAEGCDKMMGYGNNKLWEHLTAAQYAEQVAGWYAGRQPNCTKLTGADTTADLMAELTNQIIREVDAEVLGAGKKLTCYQLHYLGFVDRDAAWRHLDLGLKFDHQPTIQEFAAALRNQPCA
jgi:hypothetical protein